MIERFRFSMRSLFESQKLTEATRHGQADLKRMLMADAGLGADRPPDHSAGHASALITAHTLCRPGVRVSVSINGTLSSPRCRRHVRRPLSAKNPARRDQPGRLRLAPGTIRKVLSHPFPH